MKMIFTSYSATLHYRDPVSWLHRIRGYTGILEQLAMSHTVIGVERIGYEGSIRQGGVHYRFIDFGKPVARFPLRMHKWIRRQRPDIVFINGAVFPLQVIQLRWMLGKHARIIVLHRAEKPATGWRAWLQRRADRCIDAYLFSSASFKEDWAQHIDTQKMHEIMQASSVFQPMSRREALAKTGVTGSPVFLWVGRLDANKDPLTAVKAFLQFAPSNTAARLYLVYQQEELIEQVRNILRESANAGQVELKGYVPHEEMGYWYNSADYIVSTSHYEGSGVAVTEAMSCGCIPLVTDIPSFRGMLGANGAGRFFMAGDALALCSCLYETLSLDMIVERKKALERFGKELSFEAIARKINELVA